MDSSPGFGSRISDVRPIRTRFRSGSGYYSLSHTTDTKSLAHYAKGTPSPDPCGPGSEFFVRITFQILFHPPFGVLFTVPSRYYPLLISAPV